MNLTRRIVRVLSLAAILLTSWTLCPKPAAAEINIPSYIEVTRGDFVSLTFEDVPAGTHMSDEFYENDERLYSIDRQLSYSYSTTEPYDATFFWIPAADVVGRTITVKFINKYLDSETNQWVILEEKETTVRILPQPADVLDVIAYNDPATFYKDGEKIFEKSGYGGGARGVNVGVFNQFTGELEEVRNIDTWYYGGDEFIQNVTDYINQIPAGRIIATATADYASPITYDEGLPELFEVSFGSQYVRDVKSRGDWSMITTKGATQSLEETYRNSSDDSYEVFLYHRFDLLSSSDTTPPTGSIRINSGEVQTDNSHITVDLSDFSDVGSGITPDGKMRFSNDNQNWSEIEPFKTTKDWYLNSGSGIKTVYAQVRDKDGNWSSIKTDSIFRSEEFDTKFLSSQLNNVYPHDFEQCIDGQNIYVLYTTGSYSTPQYFQRSTDGGKTWEDNVQLAHNNAKIICGNSGDVYLYNIQGGGLKFSQNAGKTWDSINLSSFKFEEVFLDEQGVLFAFYFQETSEDYYDVFVAQSFDSGGTWTSPVQLTLAGKAYSADGYATKIAFAARNNNIVVVWRDADRSVPKDNLVVTVSRDGGNTWLTPRYLGGGTNGTRDFNVFISEENGIRIRDRFASQSKTYLSDDFGGNWALYDWGDDYYDKEEFFIDGSTLAQLSYSKYYGLQNENDELLFNIRSADGSVLGNSVTINRNFNEYVFGVPDKFYDYNDFDMCKNNNGVVAAMWYERRMNYTGASEGIDVFLNYSTDYGQTWLDDDIRLNRFLPSGNTYSLGVVCGDNYIVPFWADDVGDEYSEDANIGLFSTRIQVGPEPNNPPTINDVANRTVNPLEPMMINVSAADPDGDVITLTAKLASGAAVSTIGASFTDHGNGTGLLQWTPAAAQQNQNFDLVFTATDSKGISVTDSTRIFVANTLPLRRAKIEILSFDRQVALGNIINVTARVTNTGTLTWNQGNEVNCRPHVYKPDGKYLRDVTVDGKKMPLLAPGASTEVRLKIPTGSGKQISQSGRYRFLLDVVEEHAAWFENTAEFQVEITGEAIRKARIELKSVDQSVVFGDTIDMVLKVTNEGNFTWKPADNMNCRPHVYKPNGQYLRDIVVDGKALPEVAPGASTEVHLKIRTGLNTQLDQYGRYRFFVDIVQEHVAWFKNELEVSSTVLSSNPIIGGPVVVKDRKLMTDFDGNDEYEPYLIKGVAYQPYPVGTFPSEYGVCEYCGPNNKWCLYGAINDHFSCAGPDQVFDREDVDLARDMRLIREMNANTIRTWDKVTLKLLDAAHAQGIKVIAGFWVDWNLDYTNTTAKNTVKANFLNYVNTFKNHPAILFWAIGNENNMNVASSKKDDMFVFFNELAQTAKSAEGVNAHPVAVVNAEIADIGSSTYFSTDDKMTSVDIWGVNAYRGQNFVSMFDDYAKKSNKPLWISEFGIDAWHSQNTNYPTQGAENEDLQAQWVGSMWDDIAAHDSVLGTASTKVSIGATVMEYSDEYWKNGGQWNANSRTQEAGGFYAYGAAPDNYFSEEYWGIVRVAMASDPTYKNNIPDIITPRKVYYALQSKFKEKAPDPIVAFRTPKSVTQNWYPVSFGGVFDATPVVVAQIETLNDADPAGIRIQSLNKDGMQIKIEEEASEDAEIVHSSEIIAYLAVNKGAIKAKDGRVIGEAGAVTVGQSHKDQWHTVTLTQKYVSPIVLAQIVTLNGAQPAHVRLKNVNVGSFEFQMEEWDYLDQTREQEMINYLVLERGVFVLPDGRQIMAGGLQVNHEWKTAAFPAFNEIPALVSQAQTYNGDQAVVTRHRNVSTQSVEIILQEEEGNDAWHKHEKVGYVAIGK